MERDFSTLDASVTERVFMLVYYRKVIRKDDVDNKSLDYLFHLEISWSGKGEKENGNGKLITNK